MALDVDRDRVLAYRVAAHGLDRATGDLTDLAVFALGVQDTPSGSARLSLAARWEAPPERDPAGLSLVWTFRGGPHLHRTADLPELAAALWPLSDADATARFGVTRIREGARLGLAAFTAAAEAMREVVTEPRPRGEVSTEVSARVPASLTYDCAPCGARHISGGLFQQVGLPAGVLLLPDTSPAVLAPVGGRPEVPRPQIPRPQIPRKAEGTTALVEAYLRLHGPATLAEVAAFIGTTQRELRPAWPAGLEEVRVDGRRAWLPADRVEALRSAPAPAPGLVRLLPSSDPLLQARDRTLLVPDKARHAEVWKGIAKPGALLVGGEIEGVWRGRKAGRNRLEITVSAFAPLPESVRAAVSGEAGRVAEARGLTDVRVLLGD